jgi:hypothetical protein
MRFPWRLAAFVLISIFPSGALSAGPLTDRVVADAEALWSGSESGHGGCCDAMHVLRRLAANRNGVNAAARARLRAADPLLDSALSPHVPRAAGGRPEWRKEVHPELKGKAYRQNTPVYVHYSTDPLADPLDPDPMKAKALAEQLRDLMGDAMDILEPYLPKAIYAGVPQRKGKGKQDVLHLYVRDFSPSAAIAIAVPRVRFSARGKELPKAAAHLEIRPSVVRGLAAGGAAHADFVRSVCLHELMHAIQFRYNIRASTWFYEGMAVWAQVVYLGDNGTLSGYLKSPSSVATRPDLPFWDESTPLRAYSTAAFLLSFDHSENAPVIREWLNATSFFDDACEALNAALGLKKNSSFQQEWRTYALRLYRRDLPPLLSSEIPEPPVQLTFNTLGARFGQTVTPGGIRFYVVEAAPPPGRSQLYFSVENTGGEGLADPEMVVLHAGVPYFLARTVGIEYAEELAGIGPNAKVVVAVGQADVHNERTEKVEFRGEVISPKLIVNSIHSPPIPLGQAGVVTIGYDLLGTAVQPDEGHPVVIRTVAVGPGVFDMPSGEFGLEAGVGRTLLLATRALGNQPLQTYADIEFLTPPERYFRDAISPDIVPLHVPLTSVARSGVFGVKSRRAKPLAWFSLEFAPFGRVR